MPHPPRGYFNFTVPADAPESPAVVLHPRTSRLARAGLLVSIPALLLTPLAVVSFILSLFGWRAIWKGKGRITGRWMVFCGASLSVASFFVWDLIELTRPAPSAAAKSLTAAEQAVQRGGNDFHGGNSAEAVARATEFSEAMERLNAAFFEWKDRTKAPRDAEGTFPTYCRMTPGSCAFVIRVPRYYRYTEEAKELLPRMAWNSAHLIAAGQRMPPGTRLAVALLDGRKYVHVLTGDAADAEGSSQPNEGTSLEPFFAPGPGEEAPAMTPAHAAAASS